MKKVTKNMYVNQICELLNCEKPDYADQTKNGFSCKWVSNGFNSKLDEYQACLKFWKTVTIENGIEKNYAGYSKEDCKKGIEEEKLKMAQNVKLIKEKLNIDVKYTDKGRLIIPYAK